MPVACSMLVACSACSTHAGMPPPPWMQQGSQPPLGYAARPPLHMGPGGMAPPPGYQLRPPQGAIPPPQPPPSRPFIWHVVQHTRRSGIQAAVPARMMVVDCICGALQVMFGQVVDALSVHATSAQAKLCMQAPVQAATMVFRRLPCSMCFAVCMVETHGPGLPAGMPPPPGGYGQAPPRGMPPPPMGYQLPPGGHYRPPMQPGMRPPQMPQPAR